MILDASSGEDDQLNISDEECRLRRAEQLRKASYRCPVCGFCYEARPGEVTLCGRCLNSMIDRAQPVNGQMEMFTYISILNLPAMVEARAPQAKLAPLVEEAGDECGLSLRVGVPDDDSEAGDAALE